MKEEIKPENHTVLNNGKLVNKNHPRIALRGKLDSLLSSFLEKELILKEIDEIKLSIYLNECSKYIHKMMASEANDKIIEEIHLFGFNEKELREISHSPKKYIGTNHLFNINSNMPKTVIALNKLRTEVRETELSCIYAIENEEIDSLKEIQKSLNRLSSAIYILMCTYTVGKKEIKINI